MDTDAELGRNHVSKLQIQPEYGDEQADAGQDCRTRGANQILRRERGQGNAHFPCSAVVFDEPFCSLDSVAHFRTVPAELGTSVRIVS